MQIRFTLPAALLVATALTACVSASPTKVDEHFAPWQGAQMDELIKAWGVPPNSREVAGKHYAEFVRKELKSSPTFSIGIGGFNGGGGGSSVGGSVGTTVAGGDKLNTCTVQVEHDTEGRILAVIWQGETDICVDQFPARVR